MRPLSETLISILGSALQSGATHVDLDGGGVRLMRGEELLGVGAVDGEQLARLGEELCGLGAKRQGTAKVNIMSPAGPLDLTVSLSASAITIVLRDEATEKAERAFSMVMARLVALGGDRVTCAHGAARFAREGVLLETTPLGANVTALLVAHGRAIAGLEGDTRSGGAMLMGGSGPQSLSVELVDDGVAFSVSTLA